MGWITDIIKQKVICLKCGSIFDYDKKCHCGNKRTFNLTTHEITNNKK